MRLVGESVDAYCIILQWNQRYICLMSNGPTITVMTSVAYTIFGNTSEVLAEHGGSVVLGQNRRAAFGEERYQMKESGFGKTMI